MDLEILRVGSVVPNGFGGPSAAALGLIYTHLLQQHDIKSYKFIIVNQIGDDLNEGIFKIGPRAVHVNIRYPTSEKFNQLSSYDRNFMRLQMVNAGLDKLAISENRIDASVLKVIKEEILERKFEFDIVYKRHVCKADPSLAAEIVIHPTESSFDFFAIIKQDNAKIARFQLFIGKPNIYYADALFFYAKWKGTDELIISGKSPDMEIHISLTDNKVDYVNKSNYKNAPFFEMMKLDKSNASAAYADWIHSLPPAFASFIERSEN